VLGLVQFHLSRAWLGEAGLRRGNESPLHLAERVLLFGGLAATILVTALALTGVVTLSPIAIARWATYVILGIAAAYFVGVFTLGRLDPTEKKRVSMILVLFFASALFWAGFEQAGSSFNLFAERYTDRQIDWLNYTVPAAWFQALGPVFIIAFAPAFAALWVWLAKRQLDPSIPVKFGLGLLLLAAGFVVMAGASRVVAAGDSAQPTWLITTYLLHTFGELCVSPVGLSSVTKLAPRRLVGQMMGIWFLATSLGSLIAGLLAGEFHADRVAAWPGMYLQIIILPLAAGLLLIVFARPIKRLVAGAR
jgi:POT family proton-dependent oligopeptide transporter